MIYLYTGTPGSGKSYHVAKEIYYLLRKGRNIIANFFVNTDNIKKCKGQFIEKGNSEITVDYLLEYCKDNHKVDVKGRMLEHQTYLVIDECQLLFNSRSWNDKGRDKWTSFFTQHRKYGFEIILVTQFDRLIDRQIRSLVEYEYRHRKANNYGLFGFLLGLLVLNAPIFVCVEYWYGMREKVGLSFSIYNPKYSRLYDSYKIFETLPSAVSSVGGKGGKRSLPPAEVADGAAVVSDV